MRDTDKLLTLFSLLHLACVWVLTMISWSLLMPQISIPHFQAVCNALRCITCKLYESQTTQAAGPSVPILVSLPPGPLSPLSHGWTAEQLPELQRKPVQEFLLPSSRKCHKGEWRFLHGRLVPFLLCLARSLWQRKSKGSLWPGTCWWTCTHTEVTLQHSQVHTPVHFCK